MKKLTVFLIMLLGAAALAQDLPKIAVYVTSSDVSENEKSALGTRMLASLVNSKRYRAIERSGSFLAEIELEQAKQRSGSVDDSQISELGKQFGVKYVCVAAITPAFGSYQVSARIIDVETAEVVFIGESFSPLKTADDLKEASDEVVENMFDGQVRLEQPKPEPVPESAPESTPEPEPVPAAKTAEGAGQTETASAEPGPAAKPELPPQPKIKPSLGISGFYSGDFGGGIAWPGTNERLTMPSSNFGVQLYWDAQYLVMYLAYSTGSGKWESANASEDLPVMSHTSISFGLFIKYPIAVGASNSVRLSPLIGIGERMPLSGKLKFSDGHEYPFDGERDENGKQRPWPSVLNTLWGKIGCGLDVDLNRVVYLRSELLYGLVLLNSVKSITIGTDSYKGAESGLAHGLSLGVGVGFKY